MKSNLIIESVDNAIRLLKTGADVEFGNVRLVWDLAYKQHREYLEQKKKNELAVNEDDLEMLDKLNELISAFFTRFPKRTERTENRDALYSPMIQPSWLPKEQKTYVPDYHTIPYPIMVPDYLQGWRLDTGKEPPPTTYTTSTEFRK